MMGFNLLERSRQQRLTSLAYGFLALGFYAASVAFLVVNRDSPRMVEFGILDTLVSSLIFILLSFLLTYRRPENRISWMLAVFTLLRMTGFLRYFILVGFDNGLEKTLLFVMLANAWPWLSALTFTFLAFIFILFPDGRLPNPRWRPILSLLILQGLLMIGTAAVLSYEAAAAIRAALASGAPIVLVPLGKTGSLSLMVHVRELPAMRYQLAAAAILALIAIVFALLSQVIRYRRGNYTERQQIKWILFVMLLWIPLVINLLRPSGEFANIVAFFGPLPAVAVTLAIFRYRLYDIDILLNRTLVYGALSLILLLVYFASVVLLETLTRSIIGPQSPLATVVSTLLIASLFQPLRWRVQGLIDRAFFRKKYDAEKTLERFAALIRDEVSVENISEELLATAGNTLQPTHLSLMVAGPSEQPGPKTARSS
jgi:hypothetical protein